MQYLTTLTIHFRQGKIEFDIQTTDTSGVMFGVVLWPEQGEVGYGEVDLELLGIEDNDRIRRVLLDLHRVLMWAYSIICRGPIWKAGDGSTPIKFSNPPDAWKHQKPNKKGPSIEIGEEAK